MIGPLVDVLKPPVGRHRFAELQTAAMTEDSSVAIGTSTSRPSTVMLVATPTGMAMLEMAFSTSRSASAIWPEAASARLSTASLSRPA